MAERTPHRIRRRGPWAALALALLLLGLPGDGARAQDGYSVRGIAVDITAADAATAREIAFAEAQRTAFERLIARLAAAEDAARLQTPPDAAVAEMVTDIEVVDERTSTVRYIGTLTVRFATEPVREFLRANGASYVEASGPPVLVLPVLTDAGGSRLWDETNPWRAAWTARAFDDVLVPMVAPFGDLEDIAMIDAAQARAGDLGRLSLLARRYETEEVLVAEALVAADPATDAPTRIDLSVRRYGPRGLVATFEDRVDAALLAPAAAPTADPAAALFALAIERIVGRVEGAWKSANLVAANVEQTILVQVPIQSLAQWVSVQRKLAALPLVRRREVLSISRRQARVSLSFAGAQSQLEQALAQQQLALRPSFEDWELVAVGSEAAPGAPAGAAPAPGAGDAYLPDIAPVPEGAVPAAVPDAPAAPLPQ